MEVREIVSKAMADLDFRRALLRSPKAAVERELGVALPDEVEIEVHEETAHRIHLVLPPEEPAR